MFKVIIADDHAVVRTGLQLYFQGNSEISIEQEARNGNELLSLLCTNQFDVAIIDLNMPGRDSLDLIKEVKKIYPELPIIVFTMNTDEQLLIRLFKLGISAFINKEESPVEVYKAIKSISTGQKYLTPQQQRIFAIELISGNNNDLPHFKLTDREYQIMCLIAAGSNNSEIAAKLNISKNTISNHRNNILKKISASNNSELTKYALQHHLIN